MSLREKIIAMLESTKKVELATAELADDQGTVTNGVEEDFAVGQDIFLITQGEDGEPVNVPLPDGEFMTSEGVKMVIAEGKISDIVAPEAPAEEAEAPAEEVEASLKDKDDPCWDGYEQYGTKIKDGKEVPNCIPIEAEKEEEEEDKAYKGQDMEAIVADHDMMKAKLAEIMERLAALESKGSDVDMAVEEVAASVAKLAKAPADEPVTETVYKPQLSEKKSVNKNNQLNSRVRDIVTRYAAN